jgi:glyoxylase-like metal-dependent hydrolase (beta-lactamase superfamily II)
MPATKGSSQRPAHFEDARIRLDKLVVGSWENNVFILRDKATGEGVLLDAADEHDLIIPVAKAAGVRRVLTTHGHFDHIGAVTAARDAGLDVGVGGDDATMLPSYDWVISDGDVIEVGDLRLHAMHTPGHTKGSVCFLLEGWPILFSGDTLFPGGPGNTANGGHFPTIIKSLDERLLPLAPETIVMPGHGLDTTIGTERPHLQEWVDRGY